MLIYGAGGQARVIIDIMKARHHVIHGLIDINPALHDTLVCGIPVLGGDEVLNRLRANLTDEIIVAIGDNKIRQAKGVALAVLGFKLGQAIHPLAKISRKVTVGNNTVVAIGAIICANAKIGNDVIINSGAIVEHDNDIADAVHISPGVTLGGTVKVGERTWVGIGSTVINNVTIGTDTVVAAGSVVIHDVPDRVMVAGVPAVVKKNL